jgi:hypothetical protein
MMWKFWLTRDERYELNQKRAEEMGCELADYVTKAMTDHWEDSLRGTMSERLEGKRDLWFRDLWVYRPGQKGGWFE